jgi:large subunit ribosomal protein L10
LCAATAGIHAKKEVTTLPTPQKELTVQGLIDELGQAKAAIVADYRGLTVEQLSTLRKRLRAAGASFQVVKNTLLKRALTARNMPTMDALLEGPNAILFVDGDPVEATKTLTAYIKELRKSLPQIKGGLLGTREMTATDVEALATMPPREVALAQLIGTLQSPYANLVSTLNAVPTNLLGTLDAYQQKQQPEEGAA